MSVSSEATRSEYIGNATAATFSFTFKVFGATDLEVIHAVRTVNADDSITFTESVLVKDTDYTVSLNGSNTTKAWAGSITLVAGALANLDRIAVRRKQPLTQPADFRNEPSFLPVSHENVYDKLTHQIQTIDDRLDQCIKIHATDTSDFDVVLEAGVANNANSLLVLNDSGDGIEFGPVATDLDDAAAAAAAAEASASDAADSATIAVAAASLAEASLNSIETIYDQVKFEVSAVVTSDTTLAAEAAIVRIDPTGKTEIVITLPAADAATDVRIIAKNITTSVVPIVMSADGSDSIDGDATLTVEYAGGSVGMVSDGDATWLVIQ